VITRSLLEGELHNPRSAFWCLFFAILAPVFCPSDMVLHGMRADMATLRFASTVRRSRLVDEEKSRLVMFAVAGLHASLGRNDWRIASIVAISENMSFTMLSRSPNILFNREQKQIQLFRRPCTIVRV
jgi:hypothetical protein